MDWLKQAATSNTDAPALVLGDSVVSYGELDELADRVASAVAGAGPMFGDRVAFWGERNLRAVAAVWGVPRSGAWAVPLAIDLPAARAMDLTRRAGVKGLWALASDDELRGLRTGSSGNGEAPPSPDSRYVVFSSGSEGVPRGIVLTGSNIRAAVRASQGNLGNGPDGSWLCVLPTSHVGGLSILWRCAQQGAPVVLESRFDPVRVAGLLAEGRVRYASLVPTMLRRILQAHPGPYSGVEAVLVGGGPADPVLMAGALDAGLPVLGTYGATETVGQIATVAPGEARASVGTAGRPLEGFDVRIGDGGTIEVKGPAVAAESIEGPLRMRGDWLVMGDIGRFDEEERLIVEGRADRVVVSGGVNIHPDAIEAALAGHPDIEDVRVYGEPDPEWGTAVVAEIVAGPRFDSAAVGAWLRARLGPALVPKRWRTVEKIDRTELGKHRA